jgi:hypothetical protein
MIGKILLLSRLTEVSAGWTGSIMAKSLGKMKKMSGTHYVGHKINKWDKLYNKISNKYARTNIGKLHAFDAAIEKGGIKLPIGR